MRPRTSGAERGGTFGAFLVAVPVAFGATVLLRWSCSTITPGSELAFLRWAGAATVGVNGVALLAFFTAIFAMALRMRSLRGERARMRFEVLPADDDAVIDRDEAQRIRERIRRLQPGDRDGLLMRLLNLCTEKHATSTSVAEISEAARTFVEIERNRVDTGYSMIRYLTWSIPSIGFIGTVMGLSRSLGRFGEVEQATGSDDETLVAGQNLMSLVSNDLMLAFNTTFNALVLAIVLMFFYHRCLAREDRLLDDVASHGLHGFMARAWYPRAG